jgi:hypothetical protein
MKATMLGSPCHNGQPGRAVRSTGLVTAAARGAACATGDAPRSLQATARSNDNYLAANDARDIATDVSPFEFAAAMTAANSRCTALLATRVARNAGLRKSTSGQCLGQRQPPARPIAMARPATARDGWPATQILAQATLAHCRGSALPTRIDATRPQERTA